jgi:hypothetical protein
MQFLAKKNIIPSFLISYMLFISPLVMVGDSLQRLESYLIAILAATIALLFLSYEFKRVYGINIVLITIFGFFFKLLAGFLFWQYYMWPDYFSNEFSDISWSHYEYLYTQTSMEKLANHRIEEGFFSVPPLDFALGQGKYIFINYIMSNLYLSGNINILDFSVQNSLFACYSASMTALVSTLFGLTKKQVKIIFIIALFQPFSLITSTLSRDIFGQFFFLFGTYLFLSSLTKSPRKALIGIIFSSISMALLRSVYIAIPPFLFIVKQVKSGLFSVRKTLTIVFMLLLILIVLSRTSLISFLNTGYSSYLDVMSLKFIIAMPLDYVRAIIGPFPWINWFEFSDNTILFLSNYLQAVYVVTIIYLTTRYYKTSDSDFKFFMVFIFFILLTMSLAPGDIHNEYYSFAACLMLPISAKYLSIKKFVLNYFMVFCSFILLNVIYITVRLVI